VGIVDREFEYPNDPGNPEQTSRIEDLLLLHRAVAVDADYSQ